MGWVTEVAVSGGIANQVPGVPAATTITEIIRDLEPMGDLSKFSIEDLTPDEENAFFAILEDL